MSLHPYQPRDRRLIRAAIGVVSVAAAFASAVGAGSASAVLRASSLPAYPLTAAKAVNPLPAITVTDVRSGKPYALASALTGSKALLVWFWAPN